VDVVMEMAFLLCASGGRSTVTPLPIIVSPGIMP
jgi:hypothetical protein